MNMHGIIHFENIMRTIYKLTHKRYVELEEGDHETQTAKVETRCEKKSQIEKRKRAPGLAPHRR